MWNNKKLVSPSAIGLIASTVEVRAAPLLTANYRPDWNKFQGDRGDKVSHAFYVVQAS